MLAFLNFHLHKITLCVSFAHLTRLWRILDDIKQANEGVKDVKSHKQGRALHYCQCVRYNLGGSFSMVVGETANVDAIGQC